jgi:hypothetical protein
MEQDETLPEHPPEGLLALFVVLNDAGVPAEHVSEFSAILEAANGTDG